MTALTEDEEYANMMSKFEEFEKEELAEESDNECNEDEEYGHMISKFDKLEEVELATKLFSKCNEDENIKLDFGHYRSEYSFDQKHRNSEVMFRIVDFWVELHQICTIYLLSFSN